MARNSRKLTVDDIVAALRAEAGELDFGPQEAGLFLAVLRALAEGRPVLSGKVTHLASKLHISIERANEIMDWLAEKDESGQIIGLGGLSLGDWSHTFIVGDKEFTTWCALDTLYLTPLLKQTTQVESPDPVTEETINVVVAAEGVLNYAPQGAVISVIIPQIEQKGLQSAEQIWTAFCSYSFFFASEETARQWFDGKAVEPILLSIEEGFELGQKWFEKVGQYA